MSIKMYLKKIQLFKNSVDKYLKQVYKYGKSI
uniref:Uncharacterized protein n=1 Tax=virus sp. ctah610 TaxID=2826807 RepID=A0A8S5R7N7_9VIRU|nr:MAG TPA: hypothetical protein [virus sp. ctah610]